MSKNMKTFIFVALLVSLFLAIFISPFASSHPDGLEKVAENKGFLERGEEWAAWKSSPIPDYAVPGLRGDALATGAAGLVGTVAVFLIGYGLASIIKPKSVEQAKGGPKGGQ
ncbi:MAG: PDGLE domain-containing protein [Actinomycetota bacterium]|nr:PDGLE domain-containing protein [Actinomycetota bacterium]